MDVLARLDQTRCAINVLEHPFYLRWSAGELSPQALDLYACEYRHAVVALADASAGAAEKAGAAHRDGLRRHAEEEAAHVALWDQFAECVRGARPSEGRPPLAQTRECVRAWSAGEKLLEHLAVLYAVEAGQPEISRTKLEGLREHYGYSREGPATEYFSVHEQRDVEHAGQAARLIVELIADVPHEGEQLVERMLSRAGDALRGNWLLLDGVQEASARAA